MFTRRVIRIEGMRHLYAFFSRRAVDGSSWDEGKARLVLEGGLSESVKAIKNVHMQFLQVLLFWGDLDEEYERKRFSPLVRHLNDNSFLKRLREDGCFAGLVGCYPLFFPRDLLQLSYYEGSLQAPFFLAYKGGVVGDDVFGEDLLLVKNLLRKIIFVDGGLQGFVDLQYAGWFLHKRVAHAKLLSLVNGFAGGEVGCFDWYGDKGLSSEELFYRDLVRHVVLRDSVYERAIGEEVENWAYSRLSLVDCILIKMGLCEMFLNPEMPPGVVINEYIEIAKVYGSNKSYGFVHGLLDRLIHKMVKGGGALDV